MKKALLLAALVLPLPLAAQLGPSIGMGRGVLQTDDLMADAYHVTGVRGKDRFRAGHVRRELLRRGTGRINGG